MKVRNPNVLISGASIAGPVLAYWLKRHGFNPTVVERAPTLRKTGGHAVDLFGTGVDVAERMGILPQVLDGRTRTERLSIVRGDGRRPIDVDVARLASVLSDRHVEIMRDELSELLYEQSRDDVEYLLGDSIRTLDADGDGVDVTFERGPSRRFDLVVGADGLHSNVRRLVFGDEAAYSHYIGAYFAVFTVPNDLGLDGRMLAYSQPGRLVAVYGVRGTDEARAIFMFRRPEPLGHDHRDVAQQQRLLRAAFTGMTGEVPRLLDAMHRTPAFYFDSITQIRLDTWSKGRVTLTGDAAFCPGPVVGGSTSQAMVGAYVLAGELKAAGGDHVTAFRAYERELHDYVTGSRAFGLRAVKTLVQDTPFEVWRTNQVMRLINRLPSGLTRRLAAAQNQGLRVHSTVRLKDYERQETEPVR